MFMSRPHTGKEPACRLKQKCPGTANAAQVANRIRTINFLLQFVPKIRDVLLARLAITVFWVIAKVTRAKTTQRRHWI